MAKGGTVNNLSASYQSSCH